MFLHVFPINSLQNTLETCCDKMSLEICCQLYVQYMLVKVTPLSFLLYYFGLHKNINCSCSLWRQSQEIGHEYDNRQFI